MTADLSRVFLFLSTPSARRATVFDKIGVLATKISIHALREEGDLSFGLSRPGQCYFYPRPPRGGRRIWLSRGVGRVPFLSTPSARRATRAKARAE